MKSELNKAAVYNIGKQFTARGFSRCTKPGKCKFLIFRDEAVDRSNNRIKEYNN